MTQHCHLTKQRMVLFLGSIVTRFEGDCEERETTIWRGMADGGSTAVVCTASGFCPGAARFEISVVSISLQSRYRAASRVSQYLPMLV